MDGIELGRAHPSTIDALRRIATHVVARARFQATGRFSLRVTPGGFGTPDFGPDARRVRIAGAMLVVEHDRPGAASTTSMALAGSTLEQLADHAAVDLAAPYDVGDDMPPIGESAAQIALDPASVAVVCRWFELSSRILDRALASLPATAAPTVVRLWPEHFDVAVDALVRDGVRVNLGASPGDGHADEPYLYVGPWTDDRPGGGAFWNAGFGASRPASTLATSDEAVAFLREGWGRLAAGWAPPG